MFVCCCFSLFFESLDFLLPFVLLPGEGLYFFRQDQVTSKFPLLRFFTPGSMGSIFSDLFAECWRVGLDSVGTTVGTYEKKLHFLVLESGFVLFPAGYIYSFG